ncbi:hypothetical protein ACS0TY_031675 [Phlomoides rotata]
MEQSGSVMNLRIWKLMNELKQFELENPSKLHSPEHQVLLQIPKEEVAAFKLVKSPLYDPNPVLDEEKYQCDRDMRQLDRLIFGPRGGNGHAHSKAIRGVWEFTTIFCVSIGRKRIDAGIAPMGLSPI